MNRMDAAGEPQTGFRHQALLHSSQEQLLAGVVPYVREALDRDEAVLMVVGGPTAGLIREAIGPGAERATWGDSAGWYQRLGPMFEDFRSYLAGQAAHGRPSRVVAEQGLGAPSATWLREYLRFESMANIVYAPYGIPVLCLWDRNRVSPDIIGQVTATHQWLLEGSRTVPSAQFTDPADFLRHGGHSEWPVPGHLEFAEPLASYGDLAAARARLSEHVTRRKLPGALADELVAAVNEVAVNALEHGRPPVSLTLWRTGTSLVCECSDGGNGLADPTAGFRRPGPAGARGSGLWLARQLADLVQIRSGPAGTQVRLSFAVPGSA